jgi:hypothetical protein
VNGTPDFFDGELIGLSVISAATFETGTAKVGRPAFPGRGRRVHQCYADNRGHQLARASEKVRFVGAVYEGVNESK